MTCKEFQEVARDFARREWMSAGRLEAAETHERSCAGCRSLAAQQRQLDAALHTWAEVERETGAPPSVEAALLEKFQTRQAPALRRRRGFDWRWLAVPAAAALVLAALLLGPKPQAEVRRAVVTEPPQQQPASIRPPARDEAMDEPEEAPRPAARERLRAVRRVPRAIQAAAPAEQFIPLRYGRFIAPNESYQVFRISLPRRELLRLGLPVAPEEASLNVDAEVLVGEDGVARGIRFVK